MYLISWDYVPGKDNGRLVEYLEQNYGVDWVRTAKIEKINDYEIRIFTEKNLLTLKLNNEKTRVTLAINNVGTDEFVVKIENSKVNIYKDIEQKKQYIRREVKLESSYPYSMLAGMVLVGLIVVFAMDYYGTQSTGIFLISEAFFVIGASILIIEGRTG